MIRDFQLMGGAIAVWNFGVWLADRYEWGGYLTVLDGIVIGGVLFSIFLGVRIYVWAQIS